MNRRTTEEVLNQRGWLDSLGQLNQLEEMEADYLKNILFYLYKNRDRYWLQCEDATLIDKFEDGDEFFQLVIRKSTLWTSIIEVLESPDQGFNFEFDLPNK